MVHFGAGTVQQSVLDIIAMSEVGVDLRRILDTIQDTVNDSPARRADGPASSTEGQVSTEGPSQPQSLVIIDAVKEALLYAVKQMVKYRSEKRPLEHAYNGRALFWNLNAFCDQHSTAYNIKASYVKSAVKRGPVALAETKWDDTESMRLAQRLGDVFVYSTPGQLLSTGFRSGGVAWIMPSRWVADDVISQVTGIRPYSHPQDNNVVATLDCDLSTKWP